MKEKTSSDVYHSQGEYVAFFAREFTSMGIDEAIRVRETALGIALKENVKVREKSGTGIKKSRKTVTLPKHIWAEAYKEHTT